MEPDHPPTKKLRLDDADPSDLTRSEQTLSVGLPSPSKPTSRPRPTSERESSSDRAGGEDQKLAKPQFDGTMLTAVIGEDLSPETISQLELMSDGDLERGEGLSGRRILHSCVEPS